MTGPLPNILLPLTLPVSWSYGRIIAARNRKFDRGENITRFDLPVISVGNITTGGTGKTPMVAWIASMLMKHGVSPVIAMRGYKARSAGMSDEQAEYHEMLPGVPVVANADRIGALREFLPRHPEVKCIILDDGFQHRQIHRELDLVLIDAGAGTFGDRLLPAGNLREPLGNLRRADAVVVTHADGGIPTSEISNLKSQIAQDHGRPPLAWSRHVWTELAMFDCDGHERRVEPSWLQSNRVAVMLGIGRPQSVIDQLQERGATVAAHIPASDHEHYTPSKVAAARKACEGCDALVVTGKDWVKLCGLIDLRTWPVPIVVPRLAIEVFEGEASLRERILAAARVPTAGKPAR